MGLWSLWAAAGVVAFLPLASAQSEVSGFRVSSSYVAGSTPVSFTFDVKFDVGSIPSGTGTVTVTFYDADNSGTGNILQLFGSSATPLVTIAGVPAASAVVDGAGQTLTITPNAQINPTVDTTFSVADQTGGDLASLPAAGTDVYMDILDTTAGTFNNGPMPYAYCFKTLDSTDPLGIVITGSTDVGSTPTALTIEYILPHEVAASRLIVINADMNIFTAGIDSASADVDTSGGAVTCSAGSSSLASDFICPVSSNVFEGNTAKFVFASAALAALPSTGAVTITVYQDVDPSLPPPNPSTNAVASDTSAFTVTAAPAPTPASAGSDPIARVGNYERKFELPLHTMTPLLVAPDLFVRGSVFPGNPAEQWFDHLIISDPWNTRFLDVKVKKDLEHKNASKVRPMDFGTLDIELGTVQPRHSSKVSDMNDKISKGFLGYDIAFYKLRREHGIRMPVVGGFHRECIDMAGHSVHLYICSAPAEEYYGHLHFLALRYMHLDLHFIEVRDHNKLTGLLPELWGTQPMSDTTRSYLSPADAEFHRNDTSMCEGEANETGACMAHTKMG